RHIPLLHGRVNILPKGINGLLITSDLQGFEEGALAKPVNERIQLGHVVAAEVDDFLGRHPSYPPAAEVAAFLCGDFYALPSLDKRGGLGNVENVWRDFARRFHSVIGVAGNHDQFDGRFSFEGVFTHAQNITPLDRQMTTLGDLKVGGVSGVISLIHQRPWYHLPLNFLRYINTLLKHQPDILLLHEGPSLTISPHNGSLIVRQALYNVKKELLVLCGHRHWPEPLLNLTESVQVLNVDSTVVLLTQ
ncbi:MAG: metallophosphoesterase, partial [Anaerolineales bacterium]|nr:metallophosphoesterase [Anaerolineales bacterium]